jgi:hypothetical protein
MKALRWMLVLGLGVSFVVAPPGQAATLTVTITASTGTGSLAATVAAASAGDTIEFDATVFATPQTIQVTDVGPVSEHPAARTLRLLRPSESPDGGWQTRWVSGPRASCVAGRGCSRGARFRSSAGRRREELMHVQALVAQAPVEGLDETVLHGLPWRMKSSCTPRRYAQSSRAREVNSVP